MLTDRIFMRGAVWTQWALIAVATWATGLCDTKRAHVRHWEWQGRLVPPRSLAESGLLGLYCADVLVGQLLMGFRMGFSV